MKLPCLPHLITIGLPHFSQIRSVGFSIRLMSVMLRFGVLQVLRELLVELGHGLAPLELAFLDLVELLFHARRVGDVEDSSKLSTSRSVTTMPSSVGWNLPPSFLTYSRSWMVDRIEA